MKKIKFIKTICTGVLATMLLSSCNVNEDNTDLVPFVATGEENPVTVSQHIISNPNLSILEKALRIVEEEDADTRFLSLLNIPGNRTVFAPSNAAFTEILERNGLSDISELPVDALTNLLINHINIDQKIESSDLNNSYIQVQSTKTLNERATGTRERVRGTFNLNLHLNGEQINGSQNPVTSSIDANNGVIHILDKVIIEPSIVDLFISNPNFSSFFRAIELLETSEGSTLTILSDLRDLERSSTLLLPTNQAFEDLFLELDPTGGITTVEQIDSRTLFFVVAQHITGPFTRALGIEIAEDADPITINGRISGQTLSFDRVSKTITDNNSRIANITDLFDIHGLNGVVHTIDKVLLPIIPEPEPVVEEEVQ